MHPFSSSIKLALPVAFAALVAFAACPANAVTIQFAVLEYEEHRVDGVVGDFEFFVLIQGPGLQSGTVTPPSGPARNLTTDFPPGGLNLRETFSTFDDMQAEFGVGTYDFDISDSMGSTSFSLFFDPTEPVGFPDFTSPLNGSTVPLDFGVSWECAGCVGESLAAVYTGDGAFDVAGFPPGPGTWQPQNVVPGPATIDLNLGVTSDSQPEGFSYTQSFSHVNTIEVTVVPEPSAAALLGLGLLGLLVAGRRMPRQEARFQARAAFGLAGLR